MAKKSGKHTGKISKHGMAAHGSDGMAHGSHKAMNKAHGTPGGMDGAEEYGGHEHDKGLGHASSHGSSMTEQYHGNDGQGVPGSMSDNESCD